MAQKTSRTKWKGNLHNRKQREKEADVCLTLLYLFNMCLLFALFSIIHVHSIYVWLASIWYHFILSSIVIHIVNIAMSNGRNGCYSFLHLFCWWLQLRRKTSLHAKNEYNMIMICEFALMFFPWIKAMGFHHLHEISNIWCILSYRPLSAKIHYSVFFLRISHNLKEKPKRFVDMFILYYSIIY